MSVLASGAVENRLHLIDVEIATVRSSMLDLRLVMYRASLNTTLSDEKALLERYGQMLNQLLTRKEQVLREDYA